MDGTSMGATPTTAPSPAHPAEADARDARRMERALGWLAEHWAEQPTLAEAADAADLSEFHFQRLFSRWVGLSPKKYVQYLTLRSAKRVLDESRSVLDATYESGLSSPGRLHDLFVSVDALTPGEYKRRGAGMTVRYGFHPSPVGECLLMTTERGICGLAFTVDGDRDATLADLARGWERAGLEHAPEATAPLAERVFAGAGAPDTGPGTGEPPLRVLLRGTRFQTKVWEALLRVPPGCLVSYADLARRMGRPGAARAVGNAVGANPVAFLIPCHRVIRGSGLLGGYRWGEGRKLAVLGRELARAG